MEVTRREMITAASAIGVTAALGQAAATAAEAKAAPSTRLHWHPVTLTHANQNERCIRLLRDTNPHEFKGYKDKQLKKGPPTSGNIVRKIRAGWQTTAMTDPQDINMVYAIRYDKTNKKSYQFQFLGVDSQLFGNNRVKVQMAAEDLYLDMLSQAEPGHDPIVFENIPSSTFKVKTPVGLLMRIIIQSKHPKIELTKTKGDEQLWTLTLHR